jgi:hypothetical protein
MNISNETQQENSNPICEENQKILILQKNSDFQEENLIQSKEKEQKSNLIFMNIYVDLITYALITGVVYCSYLMFIGLDKHVEKLKSFNPSYDFPSVSRMYPAFYIFIILMVVHQLFKYLTVDKLENILSKNYSQDEILIYKNKVSTNIIKLILYSLSTILGYFALKVLSFFPWSLGGNGEYKNVFAKGYPDYLFFEKTKLFDFYYNFNLAFAIFDTYILLTYPLQSDFLFMVLHHIVTFNLVVFSFLTNFSNIGCIVYFIHYSADILSQVVRIGVHLNIPGIICCYMTMGFLVVFVYTRLFVFGDLIYHTFSFVLYKDFSIYSLYLCCFLGVLMSLNIIWIVLISKKVVNFLLTGKVEEIYKIKKTEQSKKLR